MLPRIIIVQTLGKYIKRRKIINESYLTWITMERSLRRSSLLVLSCPPLSTCHSSLKMMFATKFTLVGGSGHAVPIFKCQSGAKIKTQFMCRSTCYVQASHSKKFWAFDYKYKINQELSLAAIMAFSGQKNTIIKSPNNEMASSTKDGFEEPKISR